MSAILNHLQPMQTNKKYFVFNPSSIKQTKMKTGIQFRNMAAVAVVVFAALVSACKKNEIAPVTPPSSGTPPVVAQPPTVNAQPRVISTVENGVTIRTQTYEYDSQGNLTRYASKSGNVVDSVLIRSNNVAFKLANASTIAASLLFNTDKTFKTFFLSSDQIDFENNQTKLARMTKPGANNTPVTLGIFTYTNSNLSKIGAEITIDINYYENLPYQKGINELPTTFKPLKFYKVMELENTTSTILYNKLIRQVIIGLGTANVKTHQYSYSFDANNRVTGITEVITSTNNSSTTQTTKVSTISY